MTQAKWISDIEGPEMSEIDVLRAERRILNIPEPFDAMRANRVLAPHDG